MPRRPFVAAEPDVVEVVEVVAPLARVHAWATRQPPTPAPDCEPVLHRIRVYSPEELTCTVGGDTAIDGKCWHCGRGMDPAATPMVPTISYLQPDEYEFIRRTW